MKINEIIVGGRMFGIPRQVLRIMKITTLIMTMFLLQVSAATKAQITLNENRASLQKVLKSISKQSGYDLIYSIDDLKGTKPVNIKLNNESLERALQLCFADQPLVYEVSDKTVMIKRKQEKGIIDRIKDFFVNIDVTGKIVDEKGEPLVGASIMVKGTNQSTTSAGDGTFLLKNVSEDAVIVINFIGYKTKEVKAIKSIGAISLEMSTGQLDQVVVQAYGTTTPRLSTSNISKMSAQTIENQPVTNPLQALSGRISGVQVSQLNGLPGAGITVQIRGRNSIAASNNPLYVVDGVPFASELIGSGGTSSFVYISPLNSISPSDIESISVLKDADATSIYGSRAANGVILITTKKGLQGKAKLDFGFNHGFSTVTRTADPLSTEQYLQLRRDAFANSGITPTASNAPDLISWDSKTDNKLQDWYIGNTAQIWDATTSFSGGTQQVQFLLSGAYHEESTIFSDKDKYSRANMHMNLGYTSIDQRFKIKFSGIYSSDKNSIQGSISGPMTEIAKSVPNYPIYDSNGKYNWLSLNNFKALANAYWKANTSNLNGSLTTSYQIADGFEALANLGYSKMQNESMKPTPSISRNPALLNNLGLNTFGSVFNETILFEPQLTYTRQISKGKLNILVGSTIQNREAINDQLSMNNYVNDLLIESKAGGSVSFGTGSSAVYKYLSIFSRLTYNWADKYIINGNFRRDGSSRFGPGNRFGNFGSIGGAWIFSKENLMRNIKWLSFGKLRGSFGATGSDGIGDYGYLSLYSTVADYGTLKAISPSQISNSEYQWEVTKKLEFALDLGFFSDRLLFSTAWYRNRSGNQLVSYPLPLTTGFSGYVANLPALVENKGWEMDLNFNAIQKKDFNWSISANLTIPTNKLVSFPNIKLTSYANSLVIGESLNSYLGLRFTEIDPATGIAKFKDVNNNGVISTTSSYNDQGGDRVLVGNTDPKWFAGLNNSFSIKGFKLEVFFQYTKQSGYNLYYAQNGFSTFGLLQNAWTSYLDYWKQPGDKSTLPKPTAVVEPANGLFANSDRTFSDASYLRLKNISLSYQFLGSWLKKSGFKTVSLFLQGQNLWTSTNYNGYDPEQASSLSGASIPLVKTLSVGLRTSF